MRAARKEKRYRKGRKIYSVINRRNKRSVNLDLHPFPLTAISFVSYAINLAVLMR